MPRRHWCPPPPGSMPRHRARRRCCCAMAAGNCSPTPTSRCGAGPCGAGWPGSGCSRPRLQRTPPCRRSMPTAWWSAPSTGWATKARGWRGRAPRAEAVQSSGITLTDTSISCAPPPRITPRSGTTSAKSEPQARVM